MKRAKIQKDENIQGQQGNYKKYNIHIMGIPETEERNKIKKNERTKNGER